MFRRLYFLTTMIIFSSIALLTRAKAIETGNPLDPIILNQWDTESQFDLSQQPPAIIILDFFAYWCVPCIKTSKELEHVIFQHYQNQQGNPAGIPVRVISINVESRMPQKIKAFIEKTGARFVLDDPSGKLLKKLDGKAMPHVVVLQGHIQDDHTVWEIVYQNSGYEGSGNLRTVIDELLPKPIPVNPSTRESKAKPSVDTPVKQNDSLTEAVQTEYPIAETEILTNSKPKAPEAMVSGIAEVPESEPSLSDTTVNSIPSSSIPTGTTYTAGADWLNSSDVSYFTANILRRKTLRMSEREVSVALGRIGIDYEPVPEADVIGKPNELQESSITSQFSFTATVSDSFDIQFSGGAYKGFTDHSSLWLDEYYRQQFFGLDGYVEADPWGFNLGTGLAWDTHSYAGLMSANVVFAQDDVAPGYDRPLFQPLERGRQHLHTGALQLQQESVVTTTTRIQNQLQFTRTTDRKLRYSYSGLVNQAIGENWVLRAEGAYTFEGVEEEEESDFNWNHS